MFLIVHGGTGCYCAALPSPPPFSGKHGSTTQSFLWANWSHVPPFERQEAWFDWKSVQDWLEPMMFSMRKSGFDGKPKRKAAMPAFAQPILASFAVKSIAPNEFHRLGTRSHSMTLCVTPKNRISLDRPFRIVAFLERQSTCPDYGTASIFEFRNFSAVVAYSS